MSLVKVLFRDYRDSDYKSCESLTNEAWEFDVNFEPKELSNIVKYMFTKGSIIGSNFRKVAEVNGETVGFIFGFNEMFPKPKGGLSFGLSIFKRILCVKGMSFRAKGKLLGAINTHEKNRLKVVSREKSEIILFVVGSNHQAKGYGKKLLSEFTSLCKNSGVKSIIVDTNKDGGSSFYKSIGFNHIGDFDSPLHEYAMKYGQACMYEYKLK
ncbi:hypothetical protein MNBD_GAMMA03-325 [hydrothermal vent metagenome]|uniref:N-acetyltransferase domain-containing protein n=1 Tax=hydrothermal vent metagenome TaxID=652676 RepID=A0A3B0X0G8_9ZZZZ